ncbi:MAG: sodium-independent anion transporter, partial [Muribaculaceae bacterium]|nr:sodium-independent anion transporter [Muribaculaceae bacterium]
MKFFSRPDFQPAIIPALRHYSLEKFRSDCIAGIVVGIVALPLAIAFAIASGVSPTVGLITAVIGGFIVSACGGNTVQIGGPTGAFIVIIYNIIQLYGLSGLAIATFMAGCILLLMGFFKLGTVIKFIPYPIVVGFTAGIAVTIFSTQMPDFFGLTIAEKVPGDFISKWGVYFRYFNTINLTVLAVGIVSLLVIILTPKISKRLPGQLTAIVVVTFLVWILREYCGVEGITTIGDRFGNLDTHLPHANSIGINMESINLLLPSAFTIAMLGAIESLLSATVADGRTGDRTNSNTELIGQGIANVVVPIFGGIPVTGAIARTMTNITNGGKTPIAGVIHSLVLLLVFLFAMPLINLVPMACLAAVLIMVSYNMSGWRTVVGMASNPKGDVTVLIITFLLTVIFD